MNTATYTGVADNRIANTFRSLSIDLCQWIIAAVEQDDSSIHKIAQRLSVNKSTIERLIKCRALPRQQGRYRVSILMPYHTQLLDIVEHQLDTTLAEYCKLPFDEMGLGGSTKELMDFLEQLANMTNFPYMRITA